MVFRPTVCHIPAGEPFADAVAAGVLQRYAQDPMDLSRVTILVPSRRAIRTMREAFLRVADGQVLLLPTFRAIGDVDAAELGFSGWLLEDPAAGQVAPAVPPMVRRLMLARLVRLFTLPDGEKPDPATAVHLATALAHLLDAVQSEDVQLANLKDLVEVQYAAHWDVILDFLSVVIEQWPDVLAERGLQDPIARRNALMRVQAALWRLQPPEDPVLAAGVLASTAATSELLHVVARLPQGTVLVPGYDDLLSDEDWQVISTGTGEAAAHPQADILRLFRELGIRREEVEDWRGSADSGHVMARQVVWHEVMRPAASTSAWRHLSRESIPPLAFAGVSRVVAETPREEALVVALAIRQALEVPEQTVMVVTPDRGLADRMRGELARWSVRVDDSAGKPLGITPPGTVMRLAIAAVAAEGAPAAVLACLKHPLVHMGWSPKRFREAVRHLEKTVLRGARVQGGLAGLVAHVKAMVGAEGETVTTDDRLALVEHVLDVMQPLQTLFVAETTSVHALVSAHVAVCEALCATEDTPGAAEMWAQEAGHVAAEFCADLLAAAASFGCLPGSTYPAFFEAVLQGVVVRPRYGWHPRVQILGLMESRGAAADVVILAGLNEGIWPPDAPSDPWMSRPMRHDFGLPPYERRIGQAAHDFVQLASLPRVILTRSAKVDGAPSTPSRWLLRLDAVLQAAGIALDCTQADQLLSWARAMDRQLPPQILAPPRPMPPVAARPKSFAVTEVGRLMRDPYGVYARRILQLTPLDPLDAPLGAADRGTFIHKALEHFVREFDSIPASERQARLLTIGREALGQDWDRDLVWAFWWPRFIRIAQHFVTDEVERRKSARPVLLEQKAGVEINGVVLEGKPDRIDHRHDGQTEILDYKTGKIPAKKDVLTGYEPQLSLQGMMARRGAFGVDVPTDVAELVYVPVTGARSTKDNKNTTFSNAGQLIGEAEQGFQALLAAFADPQTPYLSHPDPARGSADPDFEHLARVQEWRVLGDGDDDFNG